MQRAYGVSSPGPLGGNPNRLQWRRSVSVDQRRVSLFEDTRKFRQAQHSTATSGGERDSGFRMHNHFHFHIHGNHFNNNGEWLRLPESGSEGETQFLPPSKLSFLEVQLSANLLGAAADGAHAEGGQRTDQVIGLSRSHKEPQLSYTELTHRNRWESRLNLSESP